MTRPLPTAQPTVLRYAAFADTPNGGNPAGIVLDAGGLDDAAMTRTAAEVGYSETAFVIEPAIGGNDRTHRLRYFSPVAEVPFCGHATIATAVVLAERIGVGRFRFETPVGTIVIETTDAGDQITAAFTSVAPEVASLAPGVQDRLLALLGLTEPDLDERYPVLSAYAGNWHPMVVLSDSDTFDALTFDPAAMRTLMDEQGWLGTVSILRALSDSRFEARNIFPVGAITEDPATGSAAASLGGYLRAIGGVAAPARIEISQGRHVGRPSRLTVDIPVDGGIVVSGTATPIP